MADEDFPSDDIPRIHYDEAFRRSVYAEVVDAASALVWGEMGVIEAARRLNLLRFKAEAEWDEDFLFFVGIDSETHHLPLGEVRDLWSATALAREDAIRAEVEQRSRDDAIKHARNLIQKFGGNAG